MNNIKNSVRLIGNLGATPEIKSLESGAKMARVSLATSEFHYEPDPTATLGKKKVTVTNSCTTISEIYFFSPSLVS